MSTQARTSRFAATAEVHSRTQPSIALRLIGDWGDLAAYYEGADGNAWTFHASSGRFTNSGEIADFRATFATRCRGVLFD